MITALILAGLVAPGGDSKTSSDYYAYVAAESADEVYLVRTNGVEAEVVQKIQVGFLPTEIEGPHGLTVDPEGQHWYLSMAHGTPFGTLYKYTTDQNQLVGQVPLGLFPATMEISMDTGLLYCVNFDLHGDMQPSSVSIVDPDAMVEVARTTVGPMPHGSRMSPDGSLHYCCSMMADELVEMDAGTFEVTRRLLLDDGTGGIARKRGDGHHAAVTKPTWVQPHPDGKTALVCLNGAAQVVEVDLRKWRVRRRFPTARGPYNLALDKQGTKMVVTYKGAAAVGVWDLEEGKELARIPTNRSVTHGVVITPDSRYALVSSEGKGAESGCVDVIDLETLKLSTSAEIGLQAGGIAFWKMEKQQ